MIVEFNSGSTIDRFQVTTDQVLGGKTVATFELKRVGSLTSGEGLMVWRQRPVWPHALRSLAVQACFKV